MSVTTDAASPRPRFQNILIIDFGQLGDVVLSLSALGAVRRRFPAARISVMTGKIADEVVALSGFADDVIMVDRVTLRDGPRLRSVAEILRLVRDVRSRKFDLVVDLHSLAETNLLAFLSGATLRLLANRENRSLDRLSNFRPKPPPENKSKHLSARYLDVVSPLGINAACDPIVIRASAADRAFVNASIFAAVEISAVGIFPGAGHPSRRWPLEKFAGLARRIEADRMLPAVFLGPEESGMRREIETTFPSSIRVIDGLSISQFLAATERLAAFITNDTGPMHLAACSGVPILLLLDARAPLTYLPLTDRAEIVRRDEIGLITVDEAFLALERLMNHGLQ